MGLCDASPPHSRRGPLRAAAILTHDCPSLLLLFPSSLPALVQTILFPPRHMSFYGYSYMTFYWPLCLPPGFPSRFSKLSCIAVCL